MYVYNNSKLTLNPLKTTITAPPSNASKWQMGFNSAFIGLKYLKTIHLKILECYNWYLRVTFCLMMAVYLSRNM